MSRFQFFNRLNSSERRFVVIVGLIIFAGVNWFWVRPHFSDLGNLRGRLRKAHDDYESRQKFIAEADKLKVEIATLLREGGGGVPAEDQSILFVRTVQSQTIQSGVNLVTSGGVNTSTNDPFFTEQTQNITVMSGEKQLVDFLYNLGKGNSQIRVRALSLRPDTPRQQLNASMTLVASYKRDQKRIQSATPGPARPPTSAAKPANQPAAQPAVQPGAKPTGQPTTPATRTNTTPPSGPVTRTFPPNPALTNRPVMPKPTPIKK
jgi:hypothetical protein